MKHSERHPAPVDECYACKLQSVQFGVVPGGFVATSSRTYFDRDSLRSSGIDLSRDEVEDKRSDYRRAMRDVEEESSTWRTRLRP